MVCFKNMLSLTSSVMQNLTDNLTHLLQLDGQIGGQAASGFTLAQLSLAMVFAYGGGILSSLTPCVYPLLPITLSMIGGVEKQSWREIASRSLSYILGMTVVYASLGVLAGLTGKVFGSLTQGATSYFLLGIIMTAAALLMLEVLSWDPSQWGSKLLALVKAPFTRKPTLTSPAATPPLLLTPKGPAGKKSVFLLGCSSGFIAAPCTTPILTVILSFIAKTQSAVFGFLLMFAFSWGLGTILLAITMVGGALHILPRSGPWLQTLRIGSGLLLLFFAEYLFYFAGRMGGVVQ